MLRKIAGQSVVVPLGNRVVEFNGIMTLSDSGAQLWEIMQKETTLDDLVNFITGEYNVDTVTAKEDIEEFVENIRAKDLLA
jgi:hypothetical protein